MRKFRLGEQLTIDDDGLVICDRYDETMHTDRDYPEMKGVSFLWLLTHRELRELKEAASGKIIKQEHRKSSNKELIPTWLIAEVFEMTDNVVKKWLQRGQLKSRKLGDVMEFLLRNPKYHDRFLGE